MGGMCTKNQEMRLSQVLSTMCVCIISYHVMYFTVTSAQLSFPFFCKVCLILLEAAVYFQISKSKYNSEKLIKGIDLLIVGIVQKEFHLVLVCKIFDPKIFGNHRWMIIN